MSTASARHVFGPVPSRRLGRSLGVDLVPFKTCTYDCVYCQLGRTTRQTVQRRAGWPSCGARGIGVLDALHRVDALVGVGAVERLFHDGNVFVAPARVGAVGKEHNESSDQRTG